MGRIIICIFTIKTQAKSASPLLGDHHILKKDGTRKWRSVFFFAKGATLISMNRDSYVEPFIDIGVVADVVHARRLMLGIIENTNSQEN